MGRKTEAVELKRHPASVAFDEWERANPGCFDVTTVGSDPKYLRNRLMHAFMAGYDVGEQRPEPEV